MTPRQQAFVREYLIDLNATQAAIRAGYSRRTANEQGARLLANASIAAAISEEQSARAARTQIDADWVLVRLAEEANADLADLYDDNGGLKPVHDWPLIWRQGLVAGVETEGQRAKGTSGSGQWRGPNQDVQDGEETFVTKIKLSDRIKRLELIGRHVNIQAFKDRVEQQHSLSPEVAKWLGLT